MLAPLMPLVEQPEFRGDRWLLAGASPGELVALGDAFAAADLFDQFEENAYMEAVPTTVIAGSLSAMRNTGYGMFTKPTPAFSIPPTSQVEVFGTSFGSAAADTVTPSGQSFGAIAPSTWAPPPGTGVWFGAALQDGVSFAFGSMSLTNNELFPSSEYQTSLFIWNTATRQLQVVAVPTVPTATFPGGCFNPPGANGSSGSTIDCCIPVTVGGVNYIYATSLSVYAGWQISTYGQPYELMVFKETNGAWAFDPTHSKTAQQLAASSTAGASAYVTGTNSHSETIYKSPGYGYIGVAPKSNHLLLGAYFTIGAAFSGSLLAFNPATGIVTAFTQIPDITDVNSVPLLFSIRGLYTNPASALNDERFVTGSDVYVRSGNANYGPHIIIEWSYNAGAGTITIKSPPMTPFTVAGIGYTLSYNLAGYDAAGNLWLPTHGGTGLGIFNSGELHCFMASGANLPTLEAGGPSGSWYNGASGQFPTTTSADFRFGSFAMPGGNDCSVTYDAARANMVVVGMGGKVIGAHLSRPAPGDGGRLFPGPELTINGGPTSGTTGWGGFFTSTLTQITDGAFTSGKCIVLTSTAGAAQAAVQGKVPVTPGQNFILSAHVKGVTVAQTITAQMFWYDASGTLVAASSAPPVTETTATTLMYVECIGSVPFGLGVTQGTLALTMTASSPGEQQRIGDVSWRLQPAVATATVDTNKVRVGVGAPMTVAPNIGDIVGNRIYFSMINLSATAYPGDIGQVLPQWLTSVDLTAVT